MNNTMLCNEECNQVRERLEEVAQYAIAAGLRKSREYSEQHPLRIIAAIAGASFLVGVFLRARKKHRG